MLRALPIRRPASLLLVVGLLVVGGCGGPDARSASTGSCDDYTTQAQAQRAADTLDGDEDGRYCERLPCPCAGPEGSSDQNDETPEATPVPRVRSGDGSAAYASRPAVVTRVIDGDTIQARLANGALQTVRLVGIDTPEKSALRSGSAECGGEEATLATQALARRWHEITLRPDPTQDAFDRYDRLLAYVEPRADPGHTFQEELLAQGWAKVYVYGAPFAKVSTFRDAARRAKDAGAGVWRACDGEFRRPLDG